MNEESLENVRKEAVQVAVMAIRIILEGDPFMDFHRIGAGLAITSDAEQIVELGLAFEKYPSPNPNMAALSGEVGERANATNDPATTEFSATVRWAVQEAKRLNPMRLAGTGLRDVNKSTDK
jgi:hypothetical protein